jgi:hypothetical protein
MKNVIRITLLFCALALLCGCGLRHVVYKPDPGCARRTLLKYTGVDAPDACWTMLGSNVAVASKSKGLLVAPDPPYSECR